MLKITTYLFHKSLYVFCLFQAILLTKITLAQSEELTPLGAERGASADGRIPEWDGGLKKPFSKADQNTSLKNPFPEDTPLFQITKDNFQEYGDNLSTGQKKLLQENPDFYMNVYPTRRSASYPQYVYDAAIANSKNATLNENGVVKNSLVTVPFPQPKNGLEAIWNHLLRFRVVNAKRNVDQAAVTSGGNYNIIRSTEEWKISYSAKDATAENLNNILLYFRQSFYAPARLAGLMLIVHETIDREKEPRHTWLYTPGQRRVTRAPFVAYDSPAPSSDGLRAFDQFDMFNGAPDRYDWKIIGKEEIYIPYNSYPLSSKDLQYDQIIGTRHLKPEHLRYELHRAWKVEATLKDGKRHIYPRRVFYLDEDSWQAAIIDMYDSQDKIWRLSEAHTINYYHLPTIWTVAETHYDFNAKRYLVMSLSNEQKIPEFNANYTPSDFNPSALRRRGLR